MAQLCDAHCHFFSRKFLEELAALKGYAGHEPSRIVAEQLGWEPPGLPHQLAERWVQELDRQRVDRVALIASALGDEVSVATAVALYPERFVGFFFVDPTAADAELRVGNAIRDLGLRVACLLPAMHRYPLHDERVARLATVLASRPGASLFVHCGVLSVGARKKLGLPSHFEMRFGNPLDLQAIATSHPTLPVIVPHFGAGMFREALMLADVCPNVYLDTSSTNGWMRYLPGLTLEEVFARALEVLGPGRLLFGTDSSFFPRGWQRAIYDRQQSALTAIGTSEEVREKIFGGNFARLFPAWA